MAKYREQIGQQLKTYREQQGWNIEQVAEMVDVKPVTIEKIENGAFDVRLSVRLPGENGVLCDAITGKTVGFTADNGRICWIARQTGDFACYIWEENA